MKNFLLVFGTLFVFFLSPAAAQEDNSFELVECKFGETEKVKKVCRRAEIFYVSARGWDKNFKKIETKLKSSDEKKEEIDHKKKELKKLEDGLSLLQEEEERIEKEIERVEEKQSDNNADYNNIDTKSFDYDSQRELELEELKNEAIATELKEEKKRWEEKLKKKAKEISEKRKEISKKKGEIEKIEGDIKEIEKEIKDLEKQREAWAFYNGFKIILKISKGKMGKPNPAEDAIYSNRELEKMFIEAAEDFEKAEKLTRKPLIRRGHILPGPEEKESGTEYLINGFLAKIINIALILIFSAGTVILIIGGFMFIFSSATQEAKTKAKDTIFWGIAGIIIAILSYALVSFVIGLDFGI